MRVKAVSIPDPQIEVLPVESRAMLSSRSGVLLLLRKGDGKAARIKFVIILSITDIASIAMMGSIVWALPGMSS